MPIVLRENTPHDIFVDLETESDVDCVSDARTAKSRVSSLEFDNGIDEILRWALWAGPPNAPVREQATVFPIDKGAVKTQEGRRPNDHSGH